MNKVFRALQALRVLLNPKVWPQLLRVAEKTRFDYPFLISWSQGAEDLALLSVLKTEKPGRYIDVGAHHPSRYSVTRHLYQEGWYGLNIDANQELIDVFNKIRIRDTNICVAVGMEQRYTFAIFVDPALSTLDLEWRNKFVSGNKKISRIIEIEGRKLRSILDDFEPHEPIDLVAIDAEGSDFQVLESIEFETLERARFPRWLLLEAAPPVSSALRTPAVELAIKWGYEPHMVLSMSTLLKFAG